MLGVRSACIARRCNARTHPAVKRGRQQPSRQSGYQPCALQQPAACAGAGTGVNRAGGRRAAPKTGENTEVTRLTILTKIFTKNVAKNVTNLTSPAIQTIVVGDVPIKKGQHGKVLSFLIPCLSGAGKEARTLDLNLGKVALYQLSYSRESSLRVYNEIQGFFNKHQKIHQVS